MRTWVLALAATLAVAVSAAADPDAPLDACAIDVAKLCPGKELGSEGALACLRARQSEASAACQDVLDARRKALFERIDDACAAEIANFCADGIGSASARLHCLRSHETALSAACRATLPRPTS
jgi:hypothetical protein